MAAALPDVVEVAKENRAFLIRAMRFIAKQTDVTQFLGCGSDNVHEVAQRINPEPKVDNDPVITAHGRALLEENNLTRYVEGDIFDRARAALRPR